MNALNKKCKRVFSLLLILALVLTSNVLPGTAKAEENPSTLTTGAMLETESEAGLASGTSISRVTPSGATISTEEGSISLIQKDVNYTVVEVSVPEADTLLSTGKADSIKVSASISYDENETYSKDNVLELKEGKTDYEADFEIFGKFSVIVSYLKAGEAVWTSESFTLGVIAQRYNFAALNATFPVTLFCLSLFKGCNDCITIGENNEPVPTFLLAERTTSINWDKLPENVYSAPTITSSDLTGISASKFFQNRKKMKAYIKDLHDLNADSTFHIFTVDNFLENMPWFMEANGIDEEHYDATILSDGSATYRYFLEKYNGTTDLTLYNKMVEEWEAFKKATLENGDVDTSILTERWNTYTSVNQNGTLFHYAAAAASADNTDWWVGRNSNTFNLTPENTELTEIAKGITTLKNIASMLKELQEAGIDQQFKEIYNFDDNMFAEAAEQNKSIMVILGTSEAGHGDLEAYINLIKDYYGDDFAYYFKGHPGFPTELYPARQTMLDKLGVVDVDSAIPAELIMFYFPDIYMCGYASTTFESASDPRMACGLFNMTKAAAAENASVQTYADLLDFFTFKVTDDNKETYSALCTNADDTYFVLEFNDDAKGDIASYDLAQHTFTYYDATDSGFVLHSETAATEVPTSGALTTEAPTPGALATEVPATEAPATNVPTLDVTGTPFETTAPSTQSSVSTTAPSSQAAVTSAPASQDAVTASPAAKSTLKNNQTITVNKVKYVAKASASGKVTLTLKGRTSKTSSLTIASTVKYKGKNYKVTKIAASAFSGDKKLKKVTIGSNITEIGKKAFYNCKNLKTITIKSKVLKKIGANAFANINKKAKFKLPASSKKSYRKLIKKAGFTNL